MEPISLTAAAIATLVFTKVTDKITEDLSEKVLEKAGNLLSLLKIKLPSTANAIELSQQQPLDYHRAVSDLDAVMKDNVVAKAVQEVNAAVNANSKIAEAIKASAKALESHPSNSQTFINTIDRSVNLAQGEGASNNIYGNQYFG